jgi:hypothetical protein
VLGQLVLVACYAAVLVVGVVLLNADAQNGWIVVITWYLGAGVVGWWLGRWKAVLLPFLSVPIAIPFGYPDAYLGGEPFPVWFSAAGAAAIAMLLIMLVTGARKQYDRRRPERN